MSRALRVVHLPANTPYVRKIVSPEFSILNGANTEHGVVPETVTAEWLLDRRPLDWLDVLHLHHIEFDEFSTLARLLAACQDADVKIVYTAHDVSPIFRDPDDFNARMDLISSSGAAWIGLTTSSVEALQDKLPGLEPVTVIPHGYVVSPDHLNGAIGLRPAVSATPQYLLYGALRPNRDYLSTIANWSLSITDPAARLNVLLRALNPADFERHDVPALLAIMKSDSRIEAAMRAFPTDAEVVAAGMRADALLLPYLFGSHSGQLELAFDLNLLPVCSPVGHIRDQYQVHKGLVGEPVWFDWGEGRPFLFGEKFVAALESVHPRLSNAPRHGPRKDFLEYRRHEHERFLGGHHSVYAS